LARPRYGQHNTSSHPSKSISIIEISKRKSRALPPGDSAKVCITGGSGFIASHITKHLREAGYKITALTGKRMSSRRRREDEFCNEFILDNLHELKSAQGLLEVDMGGMGFICSNQSVLSSSNTCYYMNMLGTSVGMMPQERSTRGKK
jgi:GDP-D-mannose 3',5'-epimerase